MPNFDDIQYEAHRRIIDPKYLELIKELEDCYYGEGSGKKRTGGWKNDTSSPFVMSGKTYDKAATPAESKVLFDKLHAAIWATRDKELIDLNSAAQVAPNALSAHKGYIVDDNGIPVLDGNGMKQICKVNDDEMDKTIEGEKKSALLQQKIKEFETKEKITVELKTISEAKRKHIAGETLSTSDRQTLGLSEA